MQGKPNPSQRLYDAIVENNLPAARQALKDGANINSQADDTKESFLHEPAKRGQKEFVLFLLENGCNPFVKSTEGKTASDVATDDVKPIIEQYKTAIDSLFQCANTGDVEGLKDLLKQDLPKKIVASNNWNLLNVASRDGHKDVVELLLQHGADINQRFGDNKISALHFAVSKEHIDVVELLCAYGANPFITVVDLHEPLFYNTTEEIEQLLKSYQSRYTCRKWGGALLVPMAPAILCYALSSDPMYPALLSGAMLGASCIFLTGLNARDTKAIAGYSAATALFMFADSVSAEYVLPCKLAAGAIAVATACYAQSHYINSGEEPQLAA